MTVIGNASIGALTCPVAAAKARHEAALEAAGLADSVGRWSSGAPSV
ncbi:MAG: hypothetical protein QME72_23515 [Rhodococcus sp. (in: high G+C Gram-positive bacteria)]|nr:hypothetical protein [Rhodococcus sp. (in: high G+C Gram-positive bacteria)]MDI6630700.1 hypothetical protein [Rhodococcus sp. (in: high G+C Gram-positive bacteria)]